MLFRWHLSKITNVLVYCSQVLEMPYFAALVTDRIQGHIKVTVMGFLFLSAALFGVLTLVLTKVT
jgi:hypothetical protein